MLFVRPTRFAGLFFMSVMLSACATFSGPFGEGEDVPPATENADGDTARDTPPVDGGESSGGLGGLLSGGSILSRVTGLFGGEEDRRPSSLGRFVEAEGIDYKVEIYGLGDSEEDNTLFDLIEASARVFRLADKPPPSVPLLRRRAEADREVVERVLKSEGYYEGSVRVAIDEASEPVRVALVIDKGEQYLLVRHDFEFAPELLPEEERRAVKAAEVPIGAPATGETVVASEGRIVASLSSNGRPYAEYGLRRAEADFDDETLSVDTLIAAGPRVLYGPTSVEGAERVEEDFIRDYVDVIPGDPASLPRLSEIQRDLAATRLFNVVRVALPDEVPEGEGPITMPVLVSVEEARHRTIGGGASFSTVNGPGARLFWEHRNYFGRGERLRAEANASLARQSLEASFRKPRFGVPERALNADIELFREDTDAFEAIGAEGGVAIDQIITDRLRGAAGVAFEVAEITEEGKKRRSYLIGGPASLAFDSSDDLLDPTEGARISLALAPWGGIFDDEASYFLINDLNASTYYAIDDEKRYIIAVRGRAAVILAESLSRVPSTKRLYVGGGGSLRGFGNKRVGPLDADNNPTGGLTAGEVGLELRAKVTESIGVVPFFEAGVLGGDRFADFDQVRYSAGLGLRYYSPVGPIRFDVAIPVNKRDKIDDDYQIYFSIGQAF